MNRPVENLSAEKLIAAYCAVWNESDPAERDRMLQAVWADDATYMDPTVHTIGRQELVEHIGKVLARYPGSKIVMTSGVDMHHGVLRFTWKKLLADGTSLPEGTDFGEISPDGKLRRIIGFFGPPARR